MQRIWQTFERYFQLTPQQSKAWWFALRHTQWSEGIAWRQTLLHFDLATVHTDVEAVRGFISRVAPPAKVIAILEDLHRERRLSRTQARQIEEKVLHRVNRDGEWV